MIAIDTNLLIYAHRSGLAEHRAAAHFGIERDGDVRSEAFNAMVLQHTKQFDLSRRRELSNLIEEKRTAGCVFKFTNSAL